MRTGARGKAMRLERWHSVTLAACMAGVVSIAADAGPEAITRIDSTRVLSYIISGIGFLGAGAILHSKKSVKGLTTAILPESDSTTVFLPTTTIFA